MVEKRLYSAPSERKTTQSHFVEPLSAISIIAVWYKPQVEHRAPLVVIY